MFQDGLRQFQSSSRQKFYKRKKRKEKKNWDSEAIRGHDHVVLRQTTHSILSSMASVDASLVYNQFNLRLYDSRPVTC